MGRSAPSPPPVPPPVLCSPHSFPLPQTGTRSRWRPEPQFSSRIGPDSDSQGWENPAGLSSHQSCRWGQPRNVPPHSQASARRSLPEDVYSGAATDWSRNPAFGGQTTAIHPDSVPAVAQRLTGLVPTVVSASPWVSQKWPFPLHHLKEAKAPGSADPTSLTPGG